MDSEVVVVRVYLKETDHGRRKTLMEEVLNILHDQHSVHGVVVFRGIAGFGSKGEVHAADILRLTVDLPIVIEFYDEPAVAMAAMDLLNDVVPAGHIVHWRAFCRNFSR
jgi:PII-like signaling protein